MGETYILLSLSTVPLAEKLKHPTLPHICIYSKKKKREQKVMNFEWIKLWLELVEE